MELRAGVLQVEGSIARIQQIYAVYEEHAKNVDQFSTVLWADLEVNKIVEATEEVQGKLKKLKHLSDCPVFDLVTKDITGFMSSLPLMKDLKSDALRKRHWNALMTVRLPVRAPTRHLFSLRHRRVGMAWQPKLRRQCWPSWCRSLERSSTWIPSHSR